MNYAQWVYDFGIINRAEKNGVSPIVQVIFEFPRKGKVFKTTQEAAWEWRRNKLPSSSSAEYIENLKTRLEFEKINGEL